jgi:hypothetical protein
VGGFAAAGCSAAAGFGSGAAAGFGSGAVGFGAVASESRCGIGTTSVPASEMCSGVSSNATLAGSVS